MDEIKSKRLLNKITESTCITQKERVKESELNEIKKQQQKAWARVRVKKTMKVIRRMEKKKCI